jgi:dipeptide/tripeptide permease
MFIPGRLLIGVVADRIGWKLSLSLTNLGLAASFIWRVTGNGATVIYGFDWATDWRKGLACPP